MDRQEYKRNWHANRQATDPEYRDRKLQAAKKYRQEIKEFVNSFKIMCMRCGENHPACLVFHHKDPTQKLFDIAAGIAAGYGKEKLRSEITKCSVLCANCHRKLHSEGWQRG